MAPTRKPAINIKALVEHHGVSGLARKTGVDVRTARRWHNKDAKPSPLASERLAEAQQEMKTKLGQQQHAPPAVPPSKGIPPLPPSGPMRRAQPSAVPPPTPGPQPPAGITQAPSGVVPSRRIQ